MADAGDLKSPGPKARKGSNPFSGTKLHVLRDLVDWSVQPWCNWWQEGLIAD
jgi:hypothetical protein